MTIVQALLFMLLGGAIVEAFEIHAWKRYQQGKREGQGYPTDMSRNRR